MKDGKMGEVKWFGPGDELFDDEFGLDNKKTGNIITDDEYLILEIDEDKNNIFDISETKYLIRS